MPVCDGAEGLDLGGVDVSPVTNRIHPLVVPQVRQDDAARRGRLRAQLVHQVKQRDRVVPSVYDISSLHEEVRQARPVARLVDHARELEHSECIWEVPVEVAHSDNVPLKGRGCVEWGLQRLLRGL